VPRLLAGRRDDDRRPSPDVAGSASITPWASANRCHCALRFFAATPRPAPGHQTSAISTYNNHFTTAAPTLVGLRRLRRHTIAAAFPLRTLDSCTGVDHRHARHLVTYGANGCAPSESVKHRVRQPSATATANDNVRLTSSQTVTGAHTVHSLVLVPTPAPRSLLRRQSARTLTLGTTVRAGKRRSRHLRQRRDDSAPTNAPARAQLDHVTQRPLSRQQRLTKTASHSTLAYSLPALHPARTTLGGGADHVTSRSVGAAFPPFGLGHLADHPAARLLRVNSSTSGAGPAPTCFHPSARVSSNKSHSTPPTTPRSSRISSRRKTHH